MMKRATTQYDKPTLPKPGDRQKYSKSTPFEVRGHNHFGDGYINFLANLGQGAENQLTSSSYQRTNEITWDRETLDSMVRQAWVIRRIVSVVPQDMCREGVSIECADLTPSNIEELQVELTRGGFWQAFEDAIMWGRLYGGAAAIMLIDGQDISTPLRPSTIGRGQLKGLYVLDRWTLWPTVNDMVRDYGPDFGLPRYYRVATGEGSGLDDKLIHHSRVLRFIGNKLPYWQAIQDLWWGQSVVETLYDRLMAFDMATFGAAQLVNKAFLRTLKVPDFTSVMAGNADAQKAILNQILFMKLTQSIESITVIDAEETLEYNSYQFAGIKDILVQLGEQVAGASEIPATRLFGQSPAGMNATGESDIKGYYDSIGSKQEKDMRYALSRLFAVLVPSTLGVPLPNTFSFKFNSLWKLSDIDKATIAQADVTSVVQAVTEGIYSPEQALKELRQLSNISGRGTTIDNTTITDAVNDPPSLGEVGPDVDESQILQMGQHLQQTDKKEDRVLGL